MKIIKLIKIWYERKNKEQLIAENWKKNENIRNKITSTIKFKIDSNLLLLLTIR